MKGQKLFLKIYIPFVIVITVALIVLQILGSKTRIGYLDFNLNTGKTLELNNLMNIKEDFIIDDKLDKESLNNYLLTNENITNYVYHFRIRYYDKIFKHSDIYGVYPDLSNLPDYIKEAEMDPDGSPFGNFVSSKIIEEDRIDNVSYILSLQFKLMTNYIILVIFILLIFLLNKYYKDILLLILSAVEIIKLNSVKYNKKIRNIFRFYLIIMSLFIVLVISFSILGNIKRYGYLSELNLRESNEDEYIYSFYINYTDNFFNNNNILYRVNHYISNLPDYIKELKIINYKDNYGELASKNIIYKEKIEGIFYTLNLNNNIFYILALMIYILLFLYIIKYIDNKNLVFTFITLLISISLFLFQFLLCFPGVADGDTWSLHYSGVTGNNYDNWHPAFIQIMLNLLFRLFGYHTFYMFLFILIFWYLGLSVIIISLYLKFKNKSVLWLFLLSFFPNIFFMNIWKLKDTLALSFFIMASALIFFTTVIKIKNNKINIALNILSVLLLVCSMLSRHNFIVTVYPVFLIFAYRILKDKNIINIKKYIMKFLCIMILFAICLLGIYKLFPKLPMIIPRSAEMASFAVYEYQIKSIAFKSNDISLIPEEWYLKDDDGNYIISVDGIYRSKSNLEISQLLNYVFDKNQMLKLGNTKNILIKYVLKYPIHYTKFIFNCALKLYTLNLDTSDILIHKRDSYRFIMYPSHWVAEDPRVNLFMNKGDEYSEIRHIIYRALFLDNIIFIDINIILFVILSLILFLIPIIIFILRHHIANDLLLFTFALSSSAFTTIVVVGTFTPVQEYRYIYPICPISIISLISFITFIYDMGGFKKFLKELRGSKK